MQYMKNIKNIITSQKYIGAKFLHIKEFKAIAMKYRAAIKGNIGAKFSMSFESALICFIKGIK